MKNKECLMKKKVLSMMLLASTLALAACGGGKDSGGSKGPQDPLDLGPDFDANYYPNKEDNKVASIVEGVSGKMTIDVALNWEGTEKAWQVLEKEYERLCGNAVDVKLITGLDTAGYTDRLRLEETNTKTTWDIVQGNLMNNLDDHSMNLRNYFYNTNPYAGNRVWADVLEESAYNVDGSGSTENTFLLNTENLSTAWFVNTRATTRAGIADTTPETWEELISMLDSLKNAGYKYPLGLSLTRDSINASQFAWLLRIYGDYYYRQQYQYTSKSYDSVNRVDPNFTYSKTSQNQESSSFYTFSFSRALSMMLDEECEYYCGPNSDVYKDFVSQFLKLKNYIRPTAYEKSFNEVRESFMAQQDGNNGDEAPQIMLDYTGSGLAFLNANALKNNLDFFDYPTMENEYVESGTLTRDVGGSGGYLSILKYGCNTNNRQLKLNKDFLQFVLSPYGQTLYYQALQRNNISPKGLTTVKSNLVVIPDEWSEFFETDKISFTGLADNNKFINAGVMSFFNNSNVASKSVELWQKIFDSRESITVNQFTFQWFNSLLSNWPTVASEKGWDQEAYFSRNFNNPNTIPD